ncbi:MAG: hypothetical protein ACXVCR_05045, partial [Bdellovibrio sp.]
GNCKTQNADKSIGTSVTVSKTGEDMPVAPSSKLDRVKVYKEDGSLQCGQGKAIPAADMQKQLKNIKVYSSENKNDGMIRIQVCGAPTGNSNVYEIDRKDLPAALKAGFKEWTFE